MALLPAASAFQAPLASVRPAPSPALRPPSAAVRGSALAGSARGRDQPLAHAWSAKHGRFGALAGGPAGMGRLRGGRVAGMAMTATSEQVQVKGAVQIEERLGKLRAGLKDEKLDALIVLSGDAHHSEYPSERDRCMKYISGFTGSAGTVMVTADGDSFLVTDGRYTIQAAQELDPATWQVMQVGARMPTMPEHLRKALGSTPKRVGVDASTCSLGTWRELEKELHPHVLVALEQSPLAKQWENDAASPRPQLPTAPAAVHPVEFAGVSAADKLSQLRSALDKEGAEAMAISTLDEVAWLLNIRGSDVAYCPVVMSHVAVTPSDAFLFVDESKLDSTVRKHVEDAGYTIKPYQDFIPTVDSLASSGLKFWVDPSVSSWAVMGALGLAAGAKPAVEKLSPMALPKAIKNTAEAKGLQDAHERDGVAMARFFSWLEKKVVAGADLDEIAAADEAERQRARVGGDKFKGLSFPTIAASGPHGAITHYFPTPEMSRKLSPDEMFLCDSGAQYADGTTDVTRTMFFGQPPAEMVRSFTYVLKGHINLASSIFPRGTLGSQLDILARSPLWKGGIDYGHGTGHGVGAYLNVHEGPHSISFRRREGEPALEPGMTTSIEPGYYEQGNYGIRIENICLVKKVEAAHKLGDSVELLTFDPLTLIPFQRKLVDAALLTHEEAQYIDAYHQRVWNTISPHLQSSDDSDALEWLRHNTAPVTQATLA